MLKSIKDYMVTKNIWLSILFLISGSTIHAMNSQNEADAAKQWINQQSLMSRKYNIINHSPTSIQVRIGTQAPVTILSNKSATFDAPSSCSQGSLTALAIILPTMDEQNKMIFEPNSLLHKTSILTCSHGPSTPDLYYYHVIESNYIMNSYNKNGAFMSTDLRSANGKAAAAAFAKWGAPQKMLIMCLSKSGASAPTPNSALQCTIVTKTQKIKTTLTKGYALIPFDQLESGDELTITNTTTKASSSVKIIINHAASGPGLCALYLEDKNTIELYASTGLVYKHS